MFLLSNENYFCMQGVGRTLFGHFILLGDLGVLGGLFFLAVQISIKESKGKLPISLCLWSVLRHTMLLQAVENLAEGYLPVGFKEWIDREQ